MFEHYLDHQVPDRRRRLRMLVAVHLAALTTTGAMGFTWLMGKLQIAQVAPPTEHKGVAVETLGIIPEESMKATLGLEGHILQLRAITIDPGGHIAKHGHATRPGLVRMISGQWAEGQESGETVYEAATPTAVSEDEDTVHWFFNRGAEPATALVCDIVPAS